MSQPAVLTGQDVGEAEEALTGLLNQVLAGTGTGITRAQYIAIPLLSGGGPMASPAAVHAEPVAQPHFGLPRLQVAELFRGLEAKGLVTGSAPDGPGPTQLTPDGTTLYAELVGAVAAVTKRVLAAFDSDDLAVAHRILIEVTERANRIRAEL